MYFNSNVLRAHSFNTLVSVLSLTLNALAFCSFIPFTISKLNWIFHQFQKNHYAEAHGFNDTVRIRCHTSSLSVPEKEAMKKVSPHSLHFSKKKKNFWNNMLYLSCCKFLISIAVGMIIVSLGKWRQNMLGKEKYVVLNIVKSAK